MQKQRYPTNWDSVPVMFDLPYASMLTGKTYDTLLRMFKAGKFPAHRIGRQIRVDKEEFIQWFRGGTA